MLAVFIGARITEDRALGSAWVVWLCEYENVWTMSGNTETLVWNDWSLDYARCGLLIFGSAHTNIVSWTNNKTPPCLSNSMQTPSVVIPSTCWATHTYVVPSCHYFTPHEPPSSLGDTKWDLCRPTAQMTWAPETNPPLHFESELHKDLWYFKTSLQSYHPFRKAEINYYFPRLMHQYNYSSCYEAMQAI